MEAHCACTYVELMRGLVCSHSQQCPEEIQRCTLLGLPPPTQLIPHPALLISFQDAIKLFIGNIPKQCTEEQLLPFFETIGKVVELVIVRDKVSHESKGSAFVWYSSRAHAERAILQFNLRHVLPDPSGEQCLTTCCLSVFPGACQWPLCRFVSRLDTAKPRME
eukprot:1159040-Pelagomonas_calceolata.AAC.10